MVSKWAFGKTSSFKHFAVLIKAIGNTLTSMHPGAAALKNLVFYGYATATLPSCLTNIAPLPPLPPAPLPPPPLPPPPLLSQSTCINHHSFAATNVVYAGQAFVMAAQAASATVTTGYLVNSTRGFDLTQAKFVNPD